MPGIAGNLYQIFLVLSSATICYHIPMNLEQFEHFMCPYCGRTNDLAIDLTGGDDQEFIVDCETCCAPIVVNVRISGDDVIAVETRKENE